MLLSLGLRNVALIEELEIQFHKGFHVLSGETGAGKSIVVDAVNLALGGRADRELIRTGCDRASVEAEFEAETADALNDVLEREQIEWDGRSLVVYRDISLFDHLTAIGKCPLVIAHGGNAVNGKSFRQVLKRCQFSDFFVLVRGS